MQGLNQTIGDVIFFSTLFFPIKYKGYIVYIASYELASENFWKFDERHYKADTFENCAVVWILT